MIIIPSLWTAARLYASEGLRVVPCAPGGKQAVMKGWPENASSDPEALRPWWSSDPSRNVALLTGEGGYDVLDVDVRPSGSGWAALETLRSAGLLTGAVAEVRTPSGGVHLYFPGTSRSEGSIPSAHLDFKATGGYVLAPPSIIRGDGGPPTRYQLAWRSAERGKPFDWARAKELLKPVTEVREPRRPASGLSRRRRRQRGPAYDPVRMAREVAEAPDGNRNITLFRVSCAAYRAGISLQPIRAAALSSGLSQEEVDRTMASACRATGRCS